MGGTAHSVIILTAALAGCATLPPECQTEYAHTISHCPPPRPRPAANEAECRSIGGVSIIRDGRFDACVSPDTAQRIFGNLYP